MVKTVKTPNYLEIDKKNSNLNLKKCIFHFHPTFGAKIQIPTKYTLNFEQKISHIVKSEFNYQNFFYFLEAWN